MKHSPAPRSRVVYRLLFLLGLAVVTVTSGAAPGPKTPLGRGVRSVAFSADGTMLAATFGEPEERGRVVLWQVADRKQIWTHEEHKGVPALAFAPDGQTLAIGSYDNLLRLLDARTGRLLKELAGHTEYVRAVAFAPDGKTLATGGWDKTVKLWDPARGTLLQSFDFPDRYALYQVAFSPSGKSLLASAMTTRIWDLGTEKERATVSGQYAVFLDDDWVVTTGETCRARNLATGEQRLLLRYPGRLAYSPQARRLAVGVHLLEYPIRKLNAKESRRLAALLVKLDDDDYAVREATGRKLLELGLAIEPELRRQMKESSSVEVRIRCRRLREDLLQRPSVTLSGHTGQVEGVAFSPEGRLFATGSKDGTVRLWSVPEGKEVACLAPR